MSYKRMTKMESTPENTKVHYDINGNTVFSKELVDLFLEEHNRLWELENDLERGKLIRLPCVVGDTVYAINGRDEVEEGLVKNYEVNNLGFILTIVSVITKDEYYLFDFDFNKDWFLTRTEAEKYLNG